MPAFNGFVDIFGKNALIHFSTKLLGAIQSVPGVQFQETNQAATRYRLDQSGLLFQVSSPGRAANPLIRVNESLNQTQFPKREIQLCPIPQHETGAMACPAHFMKTA